MSNCIWGIGKNYKDHAKEMGSAPPSKPIVFLKSYHCLNQTKNITLPSFSNEIHHEIELAVMLGKENKPSQVALALDLTARDWQTTAKKQGLPWSLAKSFIGSCPISPWISFQNMDWFNHLDFTLRVNDQVVQTSDAKKMIFSLEEILTYLKKHFPVQEGDIILTGTPSGVGPIVSGDTLSATIKEELDYSWTVL